MMRTNRQSIQEQNTHAGHLKKEKISKVKYLLHFLLFFATFNASAQSGLSNLSFENWTSGMFGPVPAGWVGFNLSHQTTGAQHGSSYTRLSNTTMGSGTMLLGSATSGNTGTVTIKGGVPCTQTPVSLSGFYKTSGLATGDAIGVIGYTSKTGSTVAMASFSQTSNVSTWTSFSVPFVVISSGPVDSLFIIASSGKIFGGPDNSINAVLDVDNLSIGATTTAIDKKSLGTAFLVYPNPASGELTIISKEEKAVTIMITDMNGKLINELPLESEKTTVDLEHYENGVYFYTIVDKEKNMLLTNRLVVNKQK